MVQRWLLLQATGWMMALTGYSHDNLAHLLLLGMRLNKQMSEPYTLNHTQCVILSKYNLSSPLKAITQSMSR